MPAINYVIVGGKKFARDPGRPVVEDIANALGTADGTVADPSATWNATAQGIVNDNTQEVTSKLAELSAILRKRGFAA